MVEIQSVLGLCICMSVHLLLIQAVYLLLPTDMLRNLEYIKPVKFFYYDHGCLAALYVT